MLWFGVLNCFCNSHSPHNGHGNTAAVSGNVMVGQPKIFCYQKQKEKTTHSFSVPFPGGPAGCEIPGSVIEKRTFVQPLWKTPKMFRVVWPDSKEAVFVPWRAMTSQNRWAEQVAVGCGKQREAAVKLTHPDSLLNWRRSTLWEPTVVLIQTKHFQVLQVGSGETSYDSRSRRVPGKAAGDDFRKGTVALAGFVPTCLIPCLRKKWTGQGLQGWHKTDRKAAHRGWIKSTFASLPGHFIYSSFPLTHTAQGRSCIPIIAFIQTLQTLACCT